MNKYENIDLEFKEVYVPDIKKEAIAFANTKGGVILIGVRKDGTVVGVSNPDEVMLQAASALKDSIRPDIMPFIQIRTILREDKPVVEITIEVGTGRPYYLHEKGLKPSGVYVRRGSSSQPLSDDGIRQMIIENTGKSFETSRSMNQDLTFHTLTAEMSARSLELGSSQMRTLHMVDEDGLYTNLALLLSDQCEHNIKLAVFQGSDKAIFRDRKEFHGSLLKQLSDIYKTIDMHNKTKADFKGLQRFDKKDYPSDAIREALLNCIVHRDYSLGGSTLINIYDNRIEFVSLGGLVSGLSMEAIFMGVSLARNPNLANLFYRMQLIESYGTGISKIRRLYATETTQPQFDSATGVFKVVLPNQNEIVQKNIVRESSFIYSAIPIVEDSEEIILNFAATRDKFRRKDIEILLGLKSTRVFHLLKALCDEGKLEVVGKGRSTYYRLKK